MFCPSSYSTVLLSVKSASHLLPSLTRFLEGSTRIRMRIDLKKTLTTCRALFLFSGVSSSNDGDVFPNNWMNHYWQRLHLSLFNFCFISFSSAQPALSNLFLKKSLYFLISKDYWRWVVKQHYLSPVLLLSKTKTLGFVWVKRDPERVKKEAGPGTAAPQEQLNWWVLGFLKKLCIQTKCRKEQQPDKANQYSQNIPNQKLSLSGTEKGKEQLSKKGNSWRSWWCSCAS